ncbi:hypothetical protein M9H77_22708 [Catharanthus roseus]|uniref:Uncharacterized protein n=1 Tax=Catharanthus roseus TaxID=4058 RepID=A0ACC0AR78_CATRO|nr:hypothetical protein M9H77_22708 [Catharanthus roseus]
MDNNMVTHMEEVLKNKLEEFEGQGKASKLFSICSISKDKLREQIGVFNQGFNGYFKSLSYRSYEHNFYDCYEGNRFGARNDYNDISCKRVPGNDVRNGGNYANMDERFHKRKGDYEGYYESYNHVGYNYRRISQALGTTSRPLSYNNLKLPLSCGTFSPYDYEVWKQKAESLFYFYCWDSKGENGKRMADQPIKTWSLMKQSLKNRFGVGNHEEQRQVQSKVKFMESLMVEDFPKNKELSQDKIEESLKIHIEDETSKEEPRCIMNEKSIETKEKERVEEKERLVEILCIFDSISIFSKESEHFKYAKEKESDLEKRASLLHSSPMFDPSYYDIGVMNNASIKSVVVGFGLDGALFHILHDKCLGKFAESVGYVSSSLDTFMENHNDFVSLNQLISFVSGQVEFSCNEEKLSNVINSLNILFENAFGFQFYHLLFKEILLKDFENQMGTNLELFKAILWHVKNLF